MKHIRIEVLVKEYTYEELDVRYQQLIQQAQTATEKSYSPYSQFKVGAAVLLANGIMVQGSNQENAAYPSGLCAERTAMFYANSQYPDQQPEAIAIAAKDANGFTQSPITPCGACRQSLLETETRYHHRIKVILYGSKSILVIDSIKDLLPLSFDEDFL